MHDKFKAAIWLSILQPNCMQHAPLPSTSAKLSQLLTCYMLQVEAHSSRAASRQQEQGEAVSQQQQRDEAAANSAGNTLVDALRNAAVTTAAGTAAAVTAAGSALTGSGTQQDAATGSAQVGSGH